MAQAAGGDGAPDTGAAPAELFADEHAFERTELETAVGLGNVDVHQAELVRLCDHVRRMGGVLVVLALLRTDLPLGEVVSQVA